MDWQGREESVNVDDRRSMSPRTMAVGGGLGGALLVMLALAFGIDPAYLTEFTGQNRQPVAENRSGDPEEARMASFSKVILRDTEVIWEDLFRKMGKRYEKPVLVLFSGHVDSACGSADSAVGPFYCPGDSKIYLDLSFFRDMERKLNARGEFARAYVISHEVGHHVQRQLGYSQRVDEARRRSSKLAANKMSIRLELQADYLAGVWAHHGQRKFNFLQRGDLESALNAAFEIGDDRLQKKARGRVVPDSFTHGTSAQRVRWFKAGFDSGDVDRARTLFELRDSEL